MGPESAQGQKLTKAIREELSAPLLATGQLTEAQLAQLPLDTLQGLYARFRSGEPPVPPPGPPPVVAGGAAGGRGNPPAARGATAMESTAPPQIPHQYEASLDFGQHWQERVPIEERLGAFKSKGPPLGGGANEAKPFMVTVEEGGQTRQYVARYATTPSGVPGDSTTAFNYGNAARKSSAASRLSDLLGIDGAHAKLAQVGRPSALVDVARRTEGHGTLAHQR